MIQYESFLFIEVPKSAERFGVFERSTIRGDMYFFHWYRDGYWNFPYALPEKLKWELLAISNEVNEETAELIVDTVIIRTEVPVRACGYIDAICYRNYMEKDQYKYHFLHPLSSYQTLLIEAGVKYNRFVILKK